MQIHSYSIPPSRFIPLFHVNNNHCSEGDSKLLSGLKEVFDQTVWSLSTVHYTHTLQTKIFNELFIPPTTASKGILNLSSLNNELRNLSLIYPQHRKEIELLTIEATLLIKQHSNRLAPIQSPMQYSKEQCDFEELCWKVATFGSKKLEIHQHNIAKQEMVYKKLLQLFPHEFPLSEREKWKQGQIAEIYTSSLFLSLGSPAPALPQEYVMLPLINFRAMPSADTNDHVNTQLGIHQYSSPVLSHYGHSYIEKIQRAFHCLQAAVTAGEDVKVKSYKMLLNDYEIYISPQFHAHFDCAITLFKALHEDLELRASISTIALAVNPLQKAASIIIYPRLCRKLAQTALSRLYAHFTPHLPIGSHCPIPFGAPRRNGLISYTQVNGMLKEELYNRNPYIFNKIFDVSGSHINIDGTERWRLDLPQGF
jgi:hypothetical protein